MDDTTLLQRFVRDGSDEAFRDLVARHTNFVYSCACQRLHDATAAQDVTQAVFLALALKAKGLSPSTPLPGWLYKATRFACAKYQRGEQRRKEREMHASEPQLDPDTTAALWQEIEPHLSGALDSLPTADREAVLLRFYRQNSYRDVAQTLRTTEDVARKRVDRALEKLRGIFTRKGVTLSGAGLTGILTANAVQAAPVGLAATCAGTALSGAWAASETLMLAKGAIHMMFIAKVTSAALITAACVVVTGSGIVAARQFAGMPPAEPPPVLLTASQPAAQTSRRPVRPATVFEMPPPTANEPTSAPAAGLLGRAGKNTRPVTLEVIAPTAIVSGLPIRFSFRLRNTGAQPVTINTYRQAQPDARAARTYHLCIQAFSDGAPQPVTIYYSTAPQLNRGAIKPGWRPQRPLAGALQELRPDESVDGEFTLTPVGRGEYKLAINGIADPGPTVKLPAGQYRFCLQYDEDYHNYEGNGAHVGIPNYYLGIAPGNPVDVELP
jgi:RNA polymerase sigma factor (sigma-70 family)